MTTKDFIKATEATPFKGGEVSDTMLEWLGNLARWSEEGTHWAYSHDRGSARTLDAVYQRGLVDKRIEAMCARRGEIRIVYVEDERWKINDRGIEAIAKAEEG